MGGSGRDKAKPQRTIVGWKREGQRTIVGLKRSEERGLSWVEVVRTKDISQGGVG